MKVFNTGKSAPFGGSLTRIGHLTMANANIHCIEAKDVSGKI